jgi:hypothetical protein
MNVIAHYLVEHIIRPQTAHQKHPKRGMLPVNDANKMQTCAQQKLHVQQEHVEVSHFKVRQNELRVRNRTVNHHQARLLGQTRCQFAQFLRFQRGNRQPCLAKASVGHRGNASVAIGDLNAHNPSFNYSIGVAVRNCFSNYSLNVPGRTALH